MEVAPTAHHIMGGLQITVACATTLPGLFACGEVGRRSAGCKPPGGKCPCRDAGFWQTRRRICRQKEKRVKKIDPAQVHQAGTVSNVSLQERKTRPQSGRNSSMPCGRAPVSSGMTPGLKDALAMANRLMPGTPPGESPRSLADCCIVENMCLTASLICRSALIRPESRGAHMRVDIVQEWDAEHSPYGHTFIARNREGIERQGVSGMKDVARNESCALIPKRTKTLILSPTR